MFELSSNQQVNSIVSMHRKKENDWISDSKEKPKKKIKHEMSYAQQAIHVDSIRIDCKRSASYCCVFCICFVYIFHI